MKVSLWLCLALISVVVFINASACDLFVTNLFYNHGFYLKNNGLINALDKGSEYLIAGLFGLVCGIWGGRKLKLAGFNYPIFSFLDAKKMLFLSVSFLGWCVAFPYSFKMFFHRARPYQTDLFGGECLFSQAFERSGECLIGDSFISGHTSFAMWLLAVALVLPKKMQKTAIVMSLMMVLLVAVSRVLGGYHFFTDVYFAMLLVGCGIFATQKKIFAADGEEN